MKKIFLILCVILPFFLVCPLNASAFNVQGTEYEEPGFLPPDFDFSEYDYYFLTVSGTPENPTYYLYVVKDKSQTGRLYFSVTKEPASSRISNGSFTSYGITTDYEVKVSSYRSSSGTFGGFSTPNSSALQNFIFDDYTTFSSSYRYIIGCNTDIYSYFGVNVRAGDYDDLNLFFLGGLHGSSDRTEKPTEPTTSGESSGGNSSGIDVDFSFLTDYFDKITDSIDDFSNKFSDILNSLDSLTDFLTASDKEDGNFLYYFSTTHHIIADLNNSLQNKLDEIKQEILNFERYFSEFSAVDGYVHNIFSAISGINQNISSLKQSIENKIDSFSSNIVNTINNFNNDILPILTFIDENIDSIKSDINNIKTDFHNFYLNFPLDFADSIKSIKSDVNNIRTDFHNFYLNFPLDFADSIKSIKSDINNIKTDFHNFLANFSIDSFFDDINLKVDSLFNDISLKIKSLPYSDILDYLKYIDLKIQSLIDSCENIYSEITSCFSQLSDISYYSKWINENIRTIIDKLIDFGDALFIHHLQAIEGLLSDIFNSFANFKVYFDTYAKLMAKNIISIKNALASLPESIKEILIYLFKPTTEKPEELMNMIKEHFAFVEDWVNLSDEIFNSENFSDEVPDYTIVIDSKLFGHFEGKIIDFSVIPYEYILWFRFLTSGIATYFFIQKVRKRLPVIINGGAET